MLGLGLFLLALGGWLAWDLSRIRDGILTDQTELALQRSQVIGQTLAKTLLAADYVLRDALGRTQPRDLVYPHPDPARQREISDMLREKAQTVPGMFNLTVFDRQCVIVANARSINLGYRSQVSVCQERQAQADNKPHFQYLPGTQSASGRPVLVASRNIRSADGVFLGGVLAVIELIYLQQWLDTLDVNHHDSLTLLDTEGVLLARKPSLPDKLGQPVQHTAFQPIFGQTSASAVRLSESPLDGWARIFALNRIDPFPIWVVVGLDQAHAHALEDWRRHLWQLVAGYLGLLALSWALARGHLAGLRQREQLVASRRLTLAVLNALPHQIAVLDAQGRIVEVNQAWTDFSINNSPHPNQSADHTDVGTNYLEICHATEPGNAQDLVEAKQAHAGILSVLQGKQALFTLEYPCHSPTEQRWFFMAVTPLPEAGGAVVVHANITARRLAEDQVRDLAHHDSLTGLPNRRLLEDRLIRVVLECLRQRQHAAILMIDLDRFKPLNDQHGHAAGDQLLIEVGRRLRLGLRAVDTAARLGGDEFVVILSGLDAQAQQARAQALAVAEKIRAALAEPYPLWLPSGPAPEALTYTCSASLGLVLLDGTEADTAVLLQRADESLYRAKSAGRNSVQVA
jgi:diguanylate cyclase (GGDEF)-like protein